MKVRAMRVRARPGQRRMVAKRGYWKELDAYVASGSQAITDALIVNNAAKRFVEGMMREFVKPIVAAVVKVAAPNESAIGGATTSAFAARKWSGQP